MKHAHLCWGWIHCAYNKHWALYQQTTHTHHFMTATPPCWPPSAVPPGRHLSVRPSLRPSPGLTFRGIHSCWGHSVPLLPSSWSINLLMCASIYVCVLVCVHPIRAKVLIACSCFFWVYTTGLCVCISGICLCDSWGCMYTCISAGVCWCQCINRVHLFLLQQHCGSLCKFHYMLACWFIFSVTCQ